MRPFVLLAALSSTAALTYGCGLRGSSAPASGSAATYTAAAARYASCMREHGVANFPSPTTTDHNGQQVTFMDPTSSVLSSPDYGTANKTCAPILPPPPQSQNAGPQQ